MPQKSPLVFLHKDLVSQNAQICAVLGLTDLFTPGLRSSCKNEMAPAPELSVFKSIAPDPAPELCFYNMALAPELCFFITWLRMCFVNTL